MFGPLLEVDMSKKCTPLWREACFQSQSAQSRPCSFGSWDVQKVHAVVAWSMFSKSKRAKQTMLFWKLRCSKSARRCGAKHISKSNVLRTDVSDISDHFWTFRCHSEVVLCGRRKGFCILLKISKVWGFCSRQGRRGTFEEDLQRCTSRGRRSTREMFIRDVRRSGRWFPAMVAFWCIRSSGLLRWFCVTGATLRMTWPHFFVAGAVITLDRWSGETTKRIGTRPSALHSTFLHFWRKSRRNVSFLMLSTSKMEEVSQNCFVFWRCQLRKLRKCVFDVVKFKSWEVSQDSFVFKLADRQIDR